jgi:replication factor C subunit 3/5
MKRLATLLVGDMSRPFPESFKHEVVHWAAHYEHRLQMGQKELFHIEAFIAKVMSVIKMGGSAIPAGGAGRA